MAALGPCCCARAFFSFGGYSSFWCTGFSLQWLLLLWNTGDVQASVVAACGVRSCGSWALERRLSSCGA